VDAPGTENSRNSEAVVQMFTVLTVAEFEQVMSGGWASLNKAKVGSSSSSSSGGGGGGNGSRSQRFKSQSSKTTKTRRIIFSTHADVLVSLYSQSKSGVDKSGNSFNFDYNASDYVYSDSKESHASDSRNSRSSVSANIDTASAGAANNASQYGPSASATTNHRNASPKDAFLNPIILSGSGAGGGDGEGYEDDEFENLSPVPGHGGDVDSGYANSNAAIDSHKMGNGSERKNGSTRVHKSGLTSSSSASALGSKSGTAKGGRPTGSHNESREKTHGGRTAQSFSSPSLANGDNDTAHSTNAKSGTASTSANVSSNPNYVPNDKLDEALARKLCLVISLQVPQKLLFTNHIRIDTDAKSAMKHQHQNTAPKNIAFPTNAVNCQAMWKRLSASPLHEGKGAGVGRSESDQENSNAAVANKYERDFDSVHEQEIAAGNSIDNAYGRADNIGTYNDNDDTECAPGDSSNENEYDSENASDEEYDNRNDYHNDHAADNDIEAYKVEGDTVLRHDSISGTMTGSEIYLLSLSLTVCDVCVGPNTLNFASICMTPPVDGAGIRSVEGRLELLLLPSQHVDSNSKILSNFHNLISDSVESHVSQLLEELTEQQSMVLKNAEEGIKQREKNLKSLRDGVEKERKAQESLLKDMRLQMASEEADGSSSSSTTKAKHRR